jgi:hypothetical protein
MVKDDKRLMPHVNGLDVSIRRLATSAANGGDGIACCFSATAKTCGTLRGTLGGA